MVDASSNPYPANIYLIKVNNKNTRKRCEICSKFTIKTPERRLYPPVKSSENRIIGFEQVNVCSVCVRNHCSKI